MRSIRNDLRIQVAVIRGLQEAAEGEVQDINCMTEQEIIKIERKHAVVPQR